MTKIHVLPLFLLFLCLASVRAQTPLGKEFADLESSDASVAQAARLAFPKILENEIPYIERDKQVICDALHSANPYMRLQGSAILVGIVVGAPEHAGIVSACIAPLMDTASDKDDDVRNNSLFVLVMGPKRATQEGHDVFMRAFGSTNYRTSELGAVGLLNEASSNSEDNRKLIQSALESTVDPKVRLNLLYAIAGSHARSDALFEAAQKSLNNSDKATAMAAIDAMVSSSSSQEKLETSLAPIVTASGVLPEVKTHAQAAIARAGK